jgi:riboflavin synthase
MFNGVIHHLGTIHTLTPLDTGGMQIGVMGAIPTQKIGASVACQGVCLTVIEAHDSFFTVDLSPVTITCTTFQYAIKGMALNLEPALRLGDSIDGHLVAGHIDGMGRVETIRSDGNSYVVSFSIPHHLRGLVAEKGSIAIDGISLTIQECTNTTITVTIIPYTWMMTTLKNMNIDDYVNIEVDMLARYVMRQRCFHP